MSKAKPFLFGSLLGASAMFVAMQYHVVRSHDGFQLVPRTPQASLGLAFADIREWDANKWTDRPELARALMAHGSTDLISQSVAENLADTVATESATLDQLRSFLNNSSDTGSAADNEMFRLPDLKPLKPNDQDAKSGDEDLFTIPFPREVKKPEVADPFRMAQSDATASGTGGASAAPALNSGSSRFTVDDILDSGAGFFQEDSGLPRSASGESSRSGGSASTASPATSTTRKIVEAFEDSLFGSSTSGSGSTAAPSRSGGSASGPIFGTELTTSGNLTNPSTSAAASPFEDISAELEGRARAALNRAESAMTDQVQQSFNNATSGAGQYVRDRVNSSFGSSLGSGSSATGGIGNPVGSGLSDEALRALREKFDPFVE